MLNACVEIKAACGKCGQPLPLNALVEKVECAYCQAESHFSYQFWNDNILDNVFEDIGDFSEGAGQTSQSVTPQGVFNMTYGRQAPCCRNCKTLLDMNKLDDYVKAGKAVCSSCQNEISVRYLPPGVRDIFIKVLYLIGEDRNLMPQNQGNVPNSTKLIVYTCPSCAASLEIDGKERMITCKSCGSEIYLPDDLWLRLHPVKTVQRWYIGINEKISEDGMVDWNMFIDCAIDKDGNVYMATAGNSNNSESKDFKLWSFGPDRKIRWERDDLKFGEYSSGITITSDGNLFLWDKSQQHLLKISCNDGSTLNIIKGSAPDSENPYSFTMIGCSSLVCDPDGTLMALINNEIVRFNQQGKRISLWGDINDEAKGHGFLSGIFNKLPGGFNPIPVKDPELAPEINELKSHPSRCNSDSIKINIGWDGNIYFSDNGYNGYVLKYDRSGNLHWCFKHGMNSVSKACADVNGSVFVLGKDVNTKSVLIKISLDGKKSDIVLTNIDKGGLLNEESAVALGFDGTIFVMYFCNILKIFNPDLKRIYISKQSAEDDESDSGDTDSESLNDDNDDSNSTEEIKFNK